MTNTTVTGYSRAVRRYTWTNRTEGKLNHTTHELRTIKTTQPMSRKVKSSSGDRSRMNPYVADAIEAGVSREGWTTSKITRVVDKLGLVLSVDVKIIEKVV